MNEYIETVQPKINSIKTTLVIPNGVPSSWIPWGSGLSPSALYARSLTCRKKAGIKTLEVKWSSIKRWNVETPTGVRLPNGTYYAVKRHESFVPFPKPSLVKRDFVILFCPNGNVFYTQKTSHSGGLIPITEDWLYTVENGVMNIEKLLSYDQEKPVPGYIESAYKNFLEEKEKADKGEENSLWIHMKRLSKNL